MSDTKLYVEPQVQSFNIESNTAAIDNILKEINSQVQSQVEYDFYAAPEITEAFLNDLYKVTLDALEKIKKDDGNLKTEEQKKLYEALKEADDNLKGPLGTIAYLPELAQRLCVLFRGLLTPDDKYVKAYNTLLTHCGQVLPNYSSFITDLIRFVSNIVRPDFVPLLDNLTSSMIECSSFVKSENVDKATAKLMLQAAGLAYGNPDNLTVDGFNKFQENLIDVNLRPYYDEDKGILEPGSGLRVWLGYKDNGTDRQVIVAFSGTDISNFKMVYADYLQLQEESVLYAHAAGLLHMICSSMTGCKIYVCGHSLGGGLAAFASTACAKTRAEIYCYTFNPACLSYTSLKYLGYDAVSFQSDKTFNFRTAYDPVSRIGGLYGTITELPKGNSNGHSLMCVEDCFQKYAPDTV